MEYGINLMACYFIVHHHGGEITATSLAGKGTTFTLRLPLTPATSRQAWETPEFFKKVVQNETRWEKLASQ